MLKRFSMRTSKKSGRRARAARQQILMDKIVDPINEPTLYNVQAATAAVLAKTSMFSDQKLIRKMNNSNRRDQVALGTLMLMNVAPVDMGKDFSLLESNSDKMPIKNPNIMDTTDFLNTLNKDTTTKDKFPTTSDPFYQLDEAVYAPLAYKTPKLSNNKIANLPDLAFVLSGLNYINQNTDFFGRNKYF